MCDEYIHTSLVEKTYWALSMLYFSKAQKVGQIKPNFHCNSPKSFPMKAIIPAKCQFSTCSCRAIQILIFQCFHKGQKYSFFFFLHLQASHQHFLNDEKGLPFPTNILASEGKDSARMKRGNFESCLGYLRHTISLCFCKIAAVSS